MKKTSKLLILTLVLTMLMSLVVIFTVPAAAATETEIAFTMGLDGAATHADGSSTSTYTETVNGYTLSIKNGTQFYTGARDAKGNGCVKLGSSKNAGSFSFTVPNDVTKVIICAAKYKDNTSKYSVNGGSAVALTQNSTNGQYDEIIIDTSTTKTITFASASGGVRLMINTIKFYVPAAGTCDHSNATKTVTKNPTCTESGTRSIECSCGYKTTETIEAPGHTTISEATCQSKAKCSVCGEYGDLGAHNYENDKCTVCEAAMPLESTISFATTGHRTQQTTEIQVWTNDGLTLTNNKGSGSNIVDSSNPVRLYKNSTLTIDYANMVKVVFVCNTVDYAASLKNSIGSGNFSVTTNGQEVTVVFNSPKDSFNITLSDGQVRMNSMTAYGQAGATICEHDFSSSEVTTAPTCTEVGERTYTCSKCGDKKTEEIAIIDHSYVNHECTMCHKVDFTHKDVDISGYYYIAAIRSSGNYWYMTNDLGTKDEKRYQAVDSEITTLPELIENAEINKAMLFYLERQSGDQYMIYAVYVDGDNYLDWKTGNTGIYSSKAEGVVLTVVSGSVAGTVNLHFAADEERYLALNEQNGNNYFAFYKSGQKQDLSLVPVNYVPHEHSYDNDCDTTCNDANCDYVREVEDHNWADIVDPENLAKNRVSEATCTSPAIYKQSCSICGVAHGNETFEYGEKAAHVYTEELENAAHLKSAGDCQTGNVYWYDCAKCNSISNKEYYTGKTKGGHNVSAEWTTDGENHWHKCTVTGCTYTEATEGHKGGTATCTVAANCEICGQAYGSANGHSYNSVDKVPATCTENGTKAHFTCSNCTTLFVEVEGQKVVTTAQELVITAPGHVFSEKIEDEAHLRQSTNCQNYNIYYYDCENCDANAKKLHFSDLTKTYRSETKVGDHVWSTVWTSGVIDGVKSHYYVCICTKTDGTCGEINPESVVACSDVTTDNNHKCDVCQAEGITEHVHSNTLTAGAETHWYECNCGDKKDEAAHVYTGWTNLENGQHKGTCTCGATKSENHSFTNYVSDENATCTADGTKTAVCDRDGCDATDTVTDAGSKLDHDYVGEWQTNNEQHWKECTCGATNKEDHSYTGYTSNNNATCTENATETGTCVCGKTHTREINDSKLGHQLSVTSFYRVDDAKLYTVTQCVRYGQGGCNYEVKTEVGVANVATEADLRLALEAGYSVKLTADIELSKGCIKITKGNEISINLNGKSIINNGVLKNNVIDVLWVCGDIDVTISGGGAMKALGVEKGKSTCVLSATDGATVVIENGSYYSDGCTTIFATRGSEIAINGGHFEAADASYLVDIDEREEGKPISTIVITGGEFVDFNPANHSNDGAANSNKLPDGYHSIKSGNVYTVGAHDYTYNEKVVDPTCEADGYTRHTCVCEDYYDDTPVAKHGHKDENHDHVCDNGCGVEQGTHAENNAHKCTYCGHTEAEWICRGGTATCTEKAICTVCGNAYGKALGHDFSNGHTCSRCGSEGVAKIGNTYYLDIQDAFDALQAGDTLVFNSHITLTDSIVIGVSATLDTGDYVVTSTAREVIVINGEGVELTVNGKFVVSNTSAALMRTGGGSAVQTVLTIEDVDNVTAILNAEFDLGAEDILYSGDVKSGYSISVKAEYAAHLARFGYATTAGEGGRVNVVERSPYYIGANGNWYMNGFDTGIKAEGQNGQNIVIDRVEEGDKVDNTTIYTIYFNIGEPVVLTVYHGNDGADGRGIAGISISNKIVDEKLVAKVVTITYTDTTTDSFEIPCGQDGQNGDSITIVGEPDVSHNSAANTTTYTVKFSNDTELSFTVKHGAQGAEGNGIKAIVTEIGEKGGVAGQWITISYTNSKDVSKFFIPHGVNGKPGSSVTVDTDRCTSSYDENTNSTTYTVYFTDSNYISFTVHHGTNGTDGIGISYVSVANGEKDGVKGQWITINYTKGEPTEFFVPNGVNGGKGDSITIVGEPNVDHDVVKNSTKYTVNFSDGNSVSFTVQHGVDGKDGNGVKGIQVATDLEKGGQWITIYYTKADAEGKSEETFFVPNGVNGTDGNGIDYVETDVDSKGNVLITINYTKSEAITVTIPKGDKGNGIQAIVSEVGTKDGVAGQWITITYTEGSETTKLFVPNGKDGANVTITKTEKTTVESVDTYTITFSDGTTVSFSVTHGIDGDKGDKGDQGDQGEAGKTPYIGENGNWWIGDKDLGIPATGSDGDSGETPYIGENGNWWIGETDTGIKAQGEDGRSNDVIILFTVGIAALCLLTTIVAVVTRKGRRSWWFIL